MFTAEQLAGLKGEKGDKGDKGDTGSAGSNGVSATHSWNGTTLTITSASGTSSANLKGDKGDTGATGKTAYEYAKDGGYTGTESEFMAKLATDYLALSGGTMTGTLCGNGGISLTANVSSANNAQGITLNNGGNTGRISLGNSGGLGIYSDNTMFIRPAYSEGTGYGVKMTKSDMSPTTNASLSLGTSSSMQYNNIYGKTIYQNGKKVANAEDVPTNKETWTFTLEDGSEVTKVVYIG